jgi:alpha-ketoglutarate-dependent taurine dioxygenase
MGSATLTFPGRPDKNYLRVKMAMIQAFPQMLQAGPTRRLAALDSRQILDALDAVGAVLLRGFDFGMDEFEDFTARFCDRFHEVGSRARLRREGDGYSSEVFRENFTLLAHSEGCYRPWPPPPELCFFFCLTPPAAPGGETSLVDGVQFAEHLPGHLRSRFLSVGVSYESHWEAERWRAEFQVADVHELDQLLRGLAGVRYTIEDDRLQFLYSTEALKPARSGDLAFANGLLAHLPRIAHPNYSSAKVYAKGSNHVYFGDGEELSDAVVNELIDVHDRLEHRHRWEARDLLLVDNTRFMHGRRMTAAPCERVLASRFGRIRASAATLSAGR